MAPFNSFNFSFIRPEIGTSRPPTLYKMAAA